MFTRNGFEEGAAGRWVLRAALVLALAGGLVGCGSDAQQDAPATTPLAGGNASQQRMELEEAVRTGRTGGERVNAVVDPTGGAVGQSTEEIENVTVPQADSPFAPGQ